MKTVAHYRVRGFGQVDVVEQNDAGDRFWDLFGSSGECLNEGSPFRTKPTRRAVEQFLNRQLKQVLSRLETECERNRIGQDGLDEAVHEAAQRNNARLNQTVEGRQQKRLISAAEAGAARVNNGGRIHQLAYLFEVYGESGTIEVLREAGAQDRGKPFPGDANRERMRTTAKRKLTARQLIHKFPRLRRNENCLTDIACPECGHRDQFRIEMKSTFTLQDDGTDGHEDTVWGRSSYCQCGQCQHEGKVRDFTFVGLDDLLRSARESKGLR